MTRRANAKFRPDSKWYAPNALRHACLLILVTGLQWLSAQQISINDPSSVPEGDAPGTAQIDFEVTLDVGDANVIEVSYTISGGNEDTNTGTLTFPAFTTGPQIISVTSNGDSLVENNEVITVTLNTPVNATILKGTGQASFLDDDDFTVTLSASDAAAAEALTDPGVFTVTLDQANNTGSPLTVNFTVGGTATEVDDYAAIGSSVDVPDGQNSAQVTVTPEDDSLFESDETVILTLGTGSGYTVGSPDTDTVTISSDDTVEVEVAATVASATEDGVTDGEFTFTLDKVNNSGAPLTINFSLTGTAAEGTDFSNIGTSVSIPDGDSSVVIPVEALEDTVVEGTQDVILTIQSDAAYTIGTNGTATVNILDNDQYSASVIALDDAADEEGPDNGTFRIGLNQTNTTGSGLVVNYTVTGTATPTGDYNALSGSVTIPNNVQNVSFDVVPKDDTEVEGPETVIVSLDNDAAYTVGAQNSATVTIADNDNYEATISATDADADEDGEDPGTFTVILSPANASGSAITVNYNLSGTATNTTDFNNLTGSVDIPNGSDTGIITVTPLDDGLVEGSETVQVDLDTGSGYVPGTPSSAMLTIADDDNYVVEVSATEDEATENPAENGEFTFTVSPANATGSDLVILYSIAGTATNGNDYNTISGTASIPNGDSSVTLSIVPQNDAVVEGTETIEVSINADPAYVLGSNTTAQIDLLDDDSATLTIADAQFDESAGTVSVDVTLDVNVSGGFTVGYTFGDDSASGASDYSGTNGTLNFAGTAGETQPISFSITEDAIVEDDETFQIALGTPSDPLIGVAGSPATFQILDNDTFTLSVSASDNSATEGADTGTFLISLDQVNQTSSPVSFSFVLSGTAGTGDYVAISSPQAISPGNQSLPLTLTAQDDSVLEGTETVVLTLDSSPSYALGTDNATVSIIDNDSATLAIGDLSFDEDDGTVNIPVQLNNEVATGTSVGFTFSDVTAVNGADYTGVDGTLTFAGTTNEIQDISVTIADDGTAELAETFQIILGTPTNGVLTSGSPATLTINDDDEFVAQLNVVDGAAAEAVANDQTGIIEVELDQVNVTGSPITVNYGISGTASGADIAPLSGSIEIPNNAQTAQILIEPVDDAMVEEGETVVIDLQGGTGYGIGASSQGTVTISDNDQFTVSVSASAPEAFEDGSTDGEFTISLDQMNTLAGAVTVNFTLGGTAIAADYQALPSSVDIGNGETSATIGVVAVDDTELEGDEILTLDLTPDAGYTLGTASADVTIKDDDSATITILPQSASEGAGTLSFQLSLNNTVSGGSEVAFEVQPGTADATDVEITTGTVTFDGTLGEVKNITLSIFEDEVFEGSETFTVDLVSATNGVTLSGTPATGTIVDNDVASFTINDNSAQENAGTLTVEVVLDTAVQGGAEVDYATAAATATGGGIDFEDASGTLSFTGTAGEIQSFTVNLIDDVVVEGNENFVVDLSNPTNGVLLADAQGNYEIADDDSATLLISDATVTEDAGAVNLLVQLNNEVALGTEVTYTVTNGTAQKNQDYSVSNGTLTFLGTAGETQAISITINEDTVLEGNETFVITLGTPTNGVLVSGSPATVTIEDNDTATLSVNSVSEAEGDGPFAFVITLNGDVAQTFSVSYNTVGVSATGGGSDFIVSSGNLTYAGNDGEQKTILIDVVDDSRVEPTETFEVTLTNPSNGVVLQGFPAVGEILDDDSAQLNIADVTVSEDSGNAVVIFELAGEVQGGFTLDYQTQDQTATASEDYTLTQGSLTFTNALNNTQSVQIPITDDEVVESEETFLLDLTNLSSPGVVLSSSSILITIQDEDVCAAGETAPQLDSNLATAFCDDLNFDLDNYLLTSVPAGAVLVWTTSNTDPLAPENVLNSSVIQQPGTYYALFLDELNNCTSPLATIAITFSTTPIAGVVSNVSACSLAENGNTLIDLDDQISGQDLGSWSLIQDPSGGQLVINSGNLLNFEGLPDGNYIFRYTTNTAVAPCTDTSVDLTISVTDCSGPCDAGDMAPMLDPEANLIFCDSIDLDLDSLVTNSAPTGAVLTWSTNPDPMVIAAHRNSQINAPGTYYGFFYDSVNMCNSPVLIVTIGLENTPTIDAVISDPVCDSGAVTLEVTVADGFQIFWYDVPAGGTPIATGDQFTSPVLTETTTYYVEAVGTNCTSPRQAVDAVVNQSPTTGTPSNLEACSTQGGAFPNVIDLDSALQGADSGTWAISVDPSNGGISINANNEVEFLGAVSGTYEFTFTTNSAQAPCTNASVTIQVVATACTADPDGDGLSNEEEEALGTDPQNPDSDGDTILDGVEVADGTNPLDDCDSVGGTPLGGSDCDLDGLSTDEEAAIGTNPDVADTDEDGILDGQEVLDGSDPLDACSPNLTPDCNPEPIDLSITKVADVNSTTIGGLINFVISLANTSMDPMGSARVSENVGLGTGFTYVSHTTDQGTYDPVTGIWEIGRVEAGESVDLNLTVRMDETGVFTNIARIIESFPTDDILSNNVSSVDINVSASIDECGFVFNQFSPNGDGLNDRLFINCIDQYPQNTLEIFDRYGSSVFSASPYRNEWFGEGDGGALPQGTYFYIFDLGDGTPVRKGWIQIIR